MGILRQWLELGRPDDSGQPAAAEPPAVSMGAPRPAAQFQLEIPPELQEAMTFGGTIEPRISRREALQVPAVLRVRNLIAGTLSTLPIDVIDAQKRPAMPTTLLEQIDPDVPNVVTLANTYEDLLFEGIAWWQVLAFGWHGYPIYARQIPHYCVNVVPDGFLRPAQQQISPDQPYPPSGRVYVDGIEVPDNEIIRFDSPNPPLLTHAARAIRIARKLDTAARLYADDPLPLGYMEPTPDAEDLDPTEIEQRLEKWEQSRAKRAWGYLADMTPKPLQWSPEQLQLVQARQHAVLEIARAAGIDPEELGVSTTSRTYSNQEQRWQAIQNLTMAAYTTAVEQRLSMRDVQPRGYRAIVRLGHFLRADTLTRMQGYEIGKRVGAITTPEIRDAENRPPLTSSELAVLREAAAPSAPAPAPTANQEDGMPAPAHAFDTALVAEDAIVIAFEATETARFRVDTDRRTVSGLIVPWNKIATNGFARWRFAPDSLHWSDVGRVKLNRNHDRTDLIGRATRLESTAEGLEGTFQLGRRQTATEALEDAADGILDGFSIEIVFDDIAGDTWQPDPADESVRLVTQATLKGNALTGGPAFDDARVRSVKASRDQLNQGGSAMPRETGTTTATGPATGTDGAAAGGEGFDLDAYTERLGQVVAEAHKTLVTNLANSFGDTLSDAVKVALENLNDPQGGGPQPVRAARYTVTREAPVYSLDGSGNTSLVRDAWYAAHARDPEAIERLRKYNRQTEDVAKLASQAVRAHLFGGTGGQLFTTVTTGNAGQVIPPGYRPDLYVPQLQRGRPIISAASPGVIGNATPFVVPVFSAVTGGAQDHVEGVNPTDGTLTFTTKTVTPGAIDGRLVLTREIVDSSNPAIDAIALAAMRESYAQQTETKVYTLLNGTNGAGGTITSGFVPSGAQAATFASTGGTPFAEAALIKGVRQRLALYPFNRFGSPTLALMGSNATQLFAGAMDSTGRPIFPSVGAENSSGLGNAYTQGWFVDGLAHVPAWAITGVASTDTQIFTLNREDLWVWESPLLTFRYEEKSGPANIELVLFGYFGTHLLRPVGLSGIRIT